MWQQVFNLLIRQDEILSPQEPRCTFVAYDGPRNLDQEIRQYFQVTGKAGDYGSEAVVSQRGLQGEGRAVVVVVVKRECYPDVNF